MVTTCFSEACSKLTVASEASGDISPTPFPSPGSGGRAGPQSSTCIDRPHCSVASGAAVLLGHLVLSCMRPLPGSGHERMHLKPHQHRKQRLSVPTWVACLDACYSQERDDNTRLCGCTYIYHPLVNPVLKYLEPTTFFTWLLLTLFSDAISFTDGKW